MTVKENDETKYSKKLQGSGNEIKNLSDNYYDIQNSSYVAFVLCRSCYKS